MAFHQKRFTGNMPRKKPSMRPCRRCPTLTTRLRKGMCYRCYLRSWRGHQTEGPCRVCGLEDVRMLRRQTLGDGMAVLCANHAAVAGRRPITLAELAAECFAPADRRAADRRTGDRRDSRERRREIEVEWLLEGDRRQSGRRAADPPAWCR